MKYLGKKEIKIKIKEIYQKEFVAWMNNKKVETLLTTCLDEWKREL